MPAPLVPVLPELEPVVSVAAPDAPDLPPAPVVAVEVALDPEGLFEVDSDVPDLTGTVLLHHVNGFMDAGSAGSILVDHLLEVGQHRVVARFDVDDLFDYRARRPASA